MLILSVPSENYHRAQYKNNSIEFEGQRGNNGAIANKSGAQSDSQFHKCKLFEIRYL